MKPWKSIRIRQFCNRAMFFLEVYHWLSLGHSHYGRYGEKKWSKEQITQGFNYCLTRVVAYKPRIARMKGNLLWSLLSISHRGLCGVHHVHEIYGLGQKGAISTPISHCEPSLKLLEMNTYKYWPPR